MNENKSNRSRRQKALKWAGKASLLAANQYLEHRNNQQLSEPTQEQSETNQEQPQPAIQVEQSETNQEDNQQQAKHPQGNKTRRWAKRASLFAANEYLRSNNQQPPEANKKLTPLETFLDILQVGVYAIGAIALTTLLLVLRFGYGVH